MIRHSPFPRVVAFDLGKVLVDFDYGIAAQKLAARARLPAREVMEVLGASPLLGDLEIGRLTNEQFHQAVCAATGFAGDLAEFSGLFADMFFPIEPMIALHAQLRESGVPTFILSNTNDLAVRHIRSRFPFYRNFTGYVLSYQHGAMKPDRKLYEVLERMAGQTGDAILYLDDRLENVEAGAARGWQVIHHQSPEATRAHMRRLRLPV